MLDPVIYRLLCMVFALLFITAGVHKLGDRTRFRGILVAYQVLPERLTAALAWLVPVSELTLGLAWAAVWRIEQVAVLSACLLAVYAVVIAVNLQRGRTYIDCGCSLASVRARKDANGTQHLSIWLVYRNGVLLLAALVAGTGVTQRPIGGLGYFSILMATLALVFLYAAFNQLLINHNAIDSWRKPLTASAAIGGEHD